MGGARTRRPGPAAAHRRSAGADRAEEEIATEGHGRNTEKRQDEYGSATGQVLTPTLLPFFRVSSVSFRGWFFFGYNGFMLDVRPEIAGALRANRPVVALESTLIAHGLPWPTNLETARAAEQAVRDQGAVPATIAVLQGRPTIGLSGADIEALAREPGAL